MNGLCPGGSCSLASDIGALIASPIHDWMLSLAGLHATLPWFLPLMAFFVGSCMASLAGLVADRVPAMADDPDLSLSNPPSHCPSCRKRIPLLALVPVLGWLVTRGRCSGCDSSVPWRYPAIEAAVGAVSLATVAALGLTTEAIALLALLWYLTVVSWLDWTTQEIPDRLSFPLIFIGLALSPFDAEPMSRIFGMGLSAVVILMAFAVVSSLKNVDANAYGDVALAAAGGAWFGLCGMTVFPVLTALSYLVYAGPLRRQGHIWVPMGPALSAGILMTCAYLTIC